MYKFTPNFQGRNLLKIAQCVKSIYSCYLAMVWFIGLAKKMTQFFGQDVVKSSQNLIIFGTQIAKNYVRIM